MDILIKGLALPRKGDSLMFYVFPSGNVDYKGFHEMETHRTTAIELPPHGDLVQRSDILRLFDENNLSAREAAMKTPVILEASK